MRALMGIDVGTSSVRSLILDPRGRILSVCREEYRFDIPEIGWAEQDPEVWWHAVCRTARRAVGQAGLGGGEIGAVGFSGQMHGLVPVTRSGEPVRRAIIWCDQRSAEQVRAIRESLGAALGRYTCNTVNTGSLVASLKWMQENERENYARTFAVLLPKDYVRFRMTGRISTDWTDAAGTLAFDVARGCWSEEFLGRLGLHVELFPEVLAPSDVAGPLIPAAAEAMGLSTDCLVVHGGADQVMQALGNGILEPGVASVTIGTGGQVLSLLTEPRYDPGLSSHTFNYLARGQWYFMGATLCAGLSLRWLRDHVLSGLSYGDMAALAAEVPPGSEGLVYLPYLLGERTPHMDPGARGMFFGLSMKHERGHLIRAAMEGVVYSLKECFAVLEALGIRVREVVASGGGSGSPLWLQLQADILNKEIYLSDMSEQASLGAAINAGVGVGCFDSYSSACRGIVTRSPNPYVPDPENAARYGEGFERYKALYRNTRELM